MYFGSKEMDKRNTVYSIFLVNLVNKESLSKA